MWVRSREGLKGRHLSLDSIYPNSNHPPILADTPHPPNSPSAYQVESEQTINGHKQIQVRLTATDCSALIGGRPPKKEIGD